MSDRLTPFELVFDRALLDRFEAIRDELAAAGYQPRDRDAFVLTRSAVSLLHELDPDGSLGAEVAGLVAFVHSAYLYWLEGQVTIALSAEQLTDVFESRFERVPAPPACYLQLPGHRVWGRSLPDQPLEPLDGLFVTVDESQFQVIAIFGMQPGRPGFTMVEAKGPEPAGWSRMPPEVPGASSAGLVEVRGPEDLLSLTYEVLALARPGKQ